VLHKLTDIAERSKEQHRRRIDPETTPTALRGNSVATLGLTDAADAYAKPHKMDDLAIGVGSYSGRMRLRALWALRPVVVRVHSSACSFPEITRLEASRRGDLEAAETAGNVRP
jgi:hypothetical protein